MKKATPGIIALAIVLAACGGSPEIQATIPVTGEQAVAETCGLMPFQETRVRFTPDFMVGRYEPMDGIDGAAYCRLGTESPGRMSMSLWVMGVENPAFSPSELGWGDPFPALGPDGAAAFSPGEYSIQAVQWTKSGYSYVLSFTNLDATARLDDVKAVATQIYSRLG